MSLLGWGSLALGAVSAYQGYKAQEASSEYTDKSLAFAESQYDRYLDIYGDVEENMATYYDSLTPEKYETMGLDAYDEQFKTAKSNYETTMAQRGLQGSGIEAEGLMSMDVQGAQQRANIQSTSDQQWAQDQLGFLSLGLGSQAGVNLSNTYTNAASTYGQQATAAGQGVGSLISGAMYANAYNPGTVNLDKFW